MDDEDDGRIADEARLRALAHPLRWSLIEILGAHGPTTAARCAELLGESQASCSFHLRQLVKYGLAEQAPTSSRRDRPYRLATIRQQWSSAPSDDLARDRAARELSRVFADRETDRIRRWVRDADLAPAAWQKAASLSGVLTWMTPDELDRLTDELSAVMQTHIDRLEHPDRRPEGARPVRLFAAGFPVFELDPDAEPDDDGAA